MGASNAGAGGSDDGFQQEPTRSTLSKKNQAKVDRKNKKEANVEMGLGTDKMSNYSVADGGTKIGGGSDNNNTITQVTKTAPTVAEVDQATTDTTPAETTEANRLLKIKKKGRSMTMMSGAKGVTKTSSDYSLGKKSLLGMV